jgi:hypothetical protein
LVGYSVFSQAKKSYYSSNVIVNFNTTVLSAGAGVIGLSMDAPNTALIPAGTLVYDVIVVDASNNVSRVLEGKVFVNPGVTNVYSSYGIDV